MYEKRVCVLKQVRKGFSADGGELTGAVYLERLGETITATPRVLGLAPVSDGHYAIVLRVNGQNFVSEMEKEIRIENAPSLRCGFSALVCFVRGDAEPVAFGHCGASSADYMSLLSSLEKIPSPLPPVEVPFPATPNAPRAPTVPLPGERPEPEKEPEKSQHGGDFGKDGKDRKDGKDGFNRYDDEAIAATDYFRAGEAIEDEEPSGARGEKEKEGKGGGDLAPHETHLPRGTLTYYNTVRDRLREAMKKYPKDERLKGVFPLSEWVRAESGALLGIIYEQGMPRYLCVAAEKKGERPEALGDTCVFVPTTLSSDEEGFWVVFQDADTGDYVELSST